MRGKEAVQDERDKRNLTASLSSASRARLCLHGPNDNAKREGSSFLD